VAILLVSPITHDVMFLSLRNDCGRWSLSLQSVRLHANLIDRFVHLSFERHEIGLSYYIIVFLIEGE
jgi:hypothetical protein